MCVDEDANLCFSYSSVESLGDYLELYSNLFLGFLMPCFGLKSKIVINLVWTS